MDYKKVFDTMVNETTKYLTDHRLKSMILGISGGIDSTVTAAVCHEVVNRHPELGLKFIDTDEETEKLMGGNIPDVLSDNGLGEDFFKAMEHEAVRKACIS